jgi:hypothetical protein
MVQAGSTSQAVLEFSPDWLQSQNGTILRGGTVVVKFAPERLSACRNSMRGAELWDIEAVAKFHPRGDLVRGSLIQHLSRDGIVATSAPRDLEVAVPSDSRQIEMWFHNFAELGGHCDAWDSRFGDNYWFDVAGLEPVQLQDPVRYRDGAIARPEFVNVYDQTAVKKDVFPAPPSGPPVGKDLRTSLSVRAWVKNIAFVKEVWIDLHVFDRSATLIKAATLGLPWQGSASGNGDLFSFDDEIYRGSTATPGSVSPRPNAWLVQYRLYYAVEGNLYTDAILHQLELVDDVIT